MHHPPSLSYFGVYHSSTLAFMLVQRAPPCLLLQEHLLSLVALLLLARLLWQAEQQVERQVGRELLPLLWRVPAALLIGQQELIGLLLRQQNAGSS